MMRMVFGCLNTYVGIDQGCLQTESSLALSSIVLSEPHREVIESDDGASSSFKRISASAKNLSEGANFHATTSRAVSPLLTLLEGSILGLDMSHSLQALDAIASEVGPASNSFIAEVLYEIPIFMASHPLEFHVCEQGLFTRSVDNVISTRQQQAAFDELVSRLKEARQELGAIHEFVYPDLFDLVLFNLARRYDLVQHKVDNSKLIHPHIVWRDIDTACRNFAIFQDGYSEVQELCPALLEVGLAPPRELAIGIASVTTRCLQRLSTAKAERLTDAVRKALGKIGPTFGNIMTDKVETRSDIDLWLFMSGNRFTRMPSNEALNIILRHTPKELRQVASLSLWKFPVLEEYQTDTFSFLDISEAERSWAELISQWGSYLQHRHKIDAVKRRFQLP